MKRIPSVKTLSRVFGDKAKTARRILEMFWAGTAQRRANAWWVAESRKGGEGVRAVLRALRLYRQTAEAPQGSEQAKQRSRELADALRELPREVALEKREGDRVAARARKFETALRRARLKALGNSVVPQVTEAIGRAMIAADSQFPVAPPTTTKEIA